MNCQCDATRPCPHTAQADVNRALAFLRGIRDLTIDQRTHVSIAIAMLERLDLPQRVLRGEFDQEVMARVRAIEADAQSRDAERAARVEQLERSRDRELRRSA